MNNVLSFELKKKKTNLVKKVLKISTWNWDMYFLLRALRDRNMPAPSVMSLEESRRTQRPYRYGMILLCVGALINWLGLAENYSEPIRYAGVTCILAGALLICTAMCCWLHTPHRTGLASNDELSDPIHVISTSEQRNRTEKPPDYDTVAIAPPSYDDAIKLDPAALLSLSVVTPPPTTASATVTGTGTSTNSSNNANLSRPCTSSYTNTFTTVNETKKGNPPPYDTAAVASLSSPNSSYEQSADASR